jgi:hypothetical protein
MMQGPVQLPVCCDVGNMGFERILTVERGSSKMLYEHGIIFGEDDQTVQH